MLTLSKLSGLVSMLRKGKRTFCIFFKREWFCESWIFPVWVLLLYVRIVWYADNSEFCDKWMGIFYIQLVLLFISRVCLFSVLFKSWFQIGRFFICFFIEKSHDFSIKKTRFSNFFNSAIIFRKIDCRLFESVSMVFCAIQISLLKFNAF